MVEHAAQPRISTLRRRALRIAHAITTPLLPDDYLGLIDPRWSAREATGTVVSLHPQTADTTTVVIKPSFTWPGHAPGQYLRIGAEIDGVRHWRAYTITSEPDHPAGLVAITVKRVQTGRMSSYFTRAAAPGSLVFLGQVEGQFRLPPAPPQRILMISAGSGVTPIWAMLRELAPRDVSDVVHIHSARTPDDVIFGDSLRALSGAHDGYRLHEQHSTAHGRLTAAMLDDLCPDWRERETFLSGPAGLMDALEAHWQADGDPARLRTERFQPIVGSGGPTGTGGTVRLRRSGIEAACAPGVSILVGTEQAGATPPYGCRMGICHTCVGTLQAGQVRDLRTGALFAEHGQPIRTCVNAPEGPVELEL